MYQCMFELKFVKNIFRSYFFITEFWDNFKNNQVHVCFIVIDELLGQNEIYKNIQNPALQNWVSDCGSFKFIIKCNKHPKILQLLKNTDGKLSFIKTNPRGSIIHKKDRVRPTQRFNAVATRRVVRRFGKNKIKISSQ